MKNCPPDCPICNRKIGFWEYIFGVTFREFIEEIHWNQILTSILCLLIFYAILNWIGIALGIFFLYMSTEVDGGAVGDDMGYIQPEIFPPNTCSANIEGCKICNNEYSHEFNEKYESNLKWWEKII